MSTNLDIDRRTFAARCSVGETSIVVACSGEGDSSAVSALAELVDRLHAIALDRRMTEVVFDVRKVTFMNSSCFTKLVTWIMRLHEPADSSYRIRILSDAKVVWQQRSLAALQALARDLITVET